MRFKDQVVCITGASSGIGWALAVEFARQGALVGVMARREERLQQLCEEIRASGGTAEFAVADASDRKATHDALRSLTDRLLLQRPELKSRLDESNPSDRGIRPTVRVREAETASESI